MLTEEQRARRHEGIGASDTPIIMGYSNYKTPYQLYLEKTRQLQIENDISEQQYWGTEIEPLIIKRFALENNVIVTTPDTVFHPEYPFIFANLDGWIESEKAVVEAKCANSFQRKELDMALNDGIPLGYLIQIAKQCLITNASRGYCAVLIGGMEYKQFIYERDLALEDLILNADLEFWECVQNKREPKLSNTSDCRLKFPIPSPDKIVEATFQIHSGLNLLQDLKEKSKELDKVMESYKMKIMEHIGTAEYLIGMNGEILVTWKATKKGTRVFNIK
jgi:putative phage-type endonuclease